MPHDFRKEYEIGLIQSWQILVEFLSARTESNKSMRDADI